MSQQLEQRLVKRLERLVAARTLTSTPAVSARVIERLRLQFEALGMTAVSGQKGDFPYLYASFLPPRQTRVWLAAHIDVVDGQDEQFKLQTKGKRLYGRGVFDMKFAIAVYEQLCQDLAGTKPPIGVMITSDEEYSGMYGSGLLAKTLPLAGRSVVLPDGGGPWQLERTAKGAIWAHIGAEGRAAHASRPHEGDSAVDRLVEAIAAVKEELEAGDGRRFAHTTVNVGRISGGQTINQVAATARADLDIRFAPPLTLDEVRQRLQRVAKRCKVELTTSGESVAYAHDLSHPHTKLMRRLIAEQIGRPVPLVDSYGSSDVQYFMAAGANSIVFYPDGGGPHTAEEFLATRSLTDTYTILGRFIEQAVSATLKPNV